MEGLRPFLQPDEIASIVKRLALEIRADYGSSSPVFIGVLSGAFVFMADLVRSVDLPSAETDFLTVKTYSGTQQSRPPVITTDITTPIEGRSVVIVDEIIDRGKTAKAIVEHIAGKRPASIKLCALLEREHERHELNPDYVGMKVGEGFLVGYGLDYNGRYRGLSGICVLERP